MKDYGDQILLGIEQQAPKLEAETNNFLQKLASITGSLPEKAHYVSFEKYITEVNHLQLTTSSDPSDITPEMVNTEALDPKP